MLLENNAVKIIDTYVSLHFILHFIAYHKYKYVFQLYLVYIYGAKNMMKKQLYINPFFCDFTMQKTN